MKKDNKIEKLYRGDKFADSLLNTIWDVIQERAVGVSIPTILGVLILLIDKVKEHAD